MNRTADCIEMTEGERLDNKDRQSEGIHEDLMKPEVYFNDSYYSFSSCKHSSIDSVGFSLFCFMFMLTLMYQPNTIKRCLLIVAIIFKLHLNHNIQNVSYKSCIFQGMTVIFVM